MILNYQKGDDPKHVVLIPSFYASVRRGSADATKIMTDGNFLPGFHLFSFLSFAQSPNPSSIWGRSTWMGLYTQLAQKHMLPSLVKYVYILYKPQTQDCRLSVSFSRNVSILSQHCSETDQHNRTVLCRGFCSIPFHPAGSSVRSIDIPYRVRSTLSSIVAVDKVRIEPTPRKSQKQERILVYKLILFLDQRYSAGLCRFPALFFNWKGFFNNNLPQIIYLHYGIVFRTLNKSEKGA